MLLIIQMQYIVIYVQEIIFIVLSDLAKNLFFFDNKKKNNTY